MNTLFEGVLHFQTQVYPENQQTYKDLEDSQSPDTLFIACSDSRVMPHLLTNTHIGELFVIRNVANQVPNFEEAASHTGVTSGIEYAVKALQVKNIVVCGHSNCGGCKAMTNHDEVKKELPLTAHWTHHSIDEKHDTARAVEEANVKVQLQHLMTYPYIEQAVKDGKLTLYGWYYDIGNGQVYNYDHEQDEFLPI